MIHCRHLFLFICLLITACSSVVSSIRDEPISDPPEERSLGTRIDDESIEVKAMVNLKASDPAFDDAHMVVVSYNGVVLLAGQVPHTAMRDAAAQIVGQIKNVRQVHNEISIGPPISWLARSNDAWITSKVKMRLMFTEGVDAGPVKTLTENGVVYLMGLVTRQEADRVVTAIQNTYGIQKIVRVFEYIE